MKKIIISIMISILTTGAQLAFADTQNYDCKLSNSEINYGARGSDVIKLQKFLVDQKLLNTKSFGTFGNSTRNSVIKYQKQNKLKLTGFLDFATIANINGKCIANNQIVPTKPTTTEVVVPVSTSSETGYPFKLEIFADKYKINPDEQVIFSVRLTNISNATVTDYKLGRIDCNSYALRIEPQIFFDKKYNFWPEAMYGNYDPCASHSTRKYEQAIPPNKSFEVRFPYKNFSRSTTAQIANYGEVTEGEHNAEATFEFFDPDNKSIKIKSNILKFYTVVDKSPEFPEISINVKTDKNKIKKGEYIKFNAVVKNIGKNDFQIIYGQQGNISETKMFYVDGVYSDKTFFATGNQNFPSDLEQDTLFKNYTGTFKVGEEKQYSSSNGVPEQMPDDGNLFAKRVKGKHYVQFVVVYVDNFGKSKRYESNKVPFEVEID